MLVNEGLAIATTNKLMETHSQCHAGYYDEQIPTCGRSTGYFLSWGQLVPFLLRFRWLRGKSDLGPGLLGV